MLLPFSTADAVVGMVCALPSVNRAPIAGHYACVSAKHASHRGELLKMLAFATLGILVVPMTLAVVLADVADLAGWLPLITGVIVVVLWMSFLPSWMQAWRNPERWTGERMTLRDLLRAVVGDD